jgi:hypothetical protein
MQNGTDHYKHPLSRSATLATVWTTTSTCWLIAETTGSDFIYYVTDQAAQQIQMNRLIKDAAEKLDPPVTVSDEEVEKVLRNGAGFESNLQGCCPCRIDY